ncbi:MAG TPA: DedA family protein [Longimicrobiaceae bacterium]|nr:DedA family protein [Longimicrobiaceae bacterium]
MDRIQGLAGLFLHLDAHLAAAVQQYGTGTYVLLFLIVFAETGLVVTPFLPGDSLLFAAGALAATGALELPVLLAGLFVAAVVGDAVNYQVGAQVGLRAFRPDAHILKTAHLERTTQFYERHGGKTIVIARFVPIVRTFAPFVAGASRMSYPRFALYNVVGAFVWVFSLTLAGYLFGNLPPVRDNFGVVVIAIVLASLVPAVVDFVRHRRQVPPLTEEPT